MAKKPPAGRGKYDRAQTTEERQQLRREKILDAATEVFAARGYAKTRVDDIVAYAGISRRTLYEDFESVEAILEEVYERAVRLNFATILERLQAAEDPIDRVFAGVGAYYDMIATHPSAARVVFHEYRSAGPAQAAKYELNTTRLVMLLFEFLNAAHASGRLTRRPDEVTCYALIKGIEAIGMRALERGEHERLTALVPTMANLIVAAFR